MATTPDGLIEAMALVVANHADDFSVFPRPLTASSREDASWDDFSASEKSVARRCAQSLLTTIRECGFAVVAVAGTRLYGELGGNAGQVDAMTGLQLTALQRANAAAYKGSINHGDPDFKTKAVED